MAASVFNVQPSDLRLGAILSRGSPGVTLYQGELQLGKHVTMVHKLELGDTLCNVNSCDGPPHSLQVAVKRLHSGIAPAAAEAAFLDEVRTLQLASSACQRACRMLGCCKLDGDACIIMSLYPKSAAKRLEETQGQVLLTH